MNDRNLHKLHKFYAVIRVRVLVITYKFLLIFNFFVLISKVGISIDYKPFGKRSKKLKLVSFEQNLCNLLHGKAIEAVLRPLAKYFEYYTNLITGCPFYPVCL